MQYENFTLVEGGIASKGNGKRLGQEENLKCVVMQKPREERYSRRRGEKPSLMLLSYHLRIEQNGLIKFWKCIGFC